jgi:hypothetical protein
MLCGDPYGKCVVGYLRSLFAKEGKSFLMRKQYSVHEGWQWSSRVDLTAKRFGMGKRLPGNVSRLYQDQPRRQITNQSNPGRTFNDGSDKSGIIVLSRIVLLSFLTQKHLHSSTVVRDLSIITYSLIIFPLEDIIDIYYDNFETISLQPIKSP